MKRDKENRAYPLGYGYAPMLGSYAYIGEDAARDLRSYAP